MVSSSHAWMWELDCKERWALKNWCFWTVVLEKTLESSLDCKKDKPANPKGNQSWIFIERTDAVAETPILWPPDVAKEELIHWKRPWCWERWKAGGEGDNRGWDGWHHGLDGRESEWTLGDGDGQEGLACCDLWGRKELDTTEWLNWTEGFSVLPGALFCLSIHRFLCEKTAKFIHVFTP